MGCGSSNLARENLPPPIDWTRYNPTGDSATDQHRAQELAEVAEANWLNDDLYMRCLNQARQLDPSNSKIALSLAWKYGLRASTGDMSKRPDDEQSEAYILQSHAKAEELYSEAHRLGGPLDRSEIDRWAHAVISQGKHRQADHDHILTLKPPDYKDVAKDAHIAYRDARYDEAISLYKSAYDLSHKPTYLTEIAYCYIQAKGLASPEAVSASKAALHEVSILASKPKYGIETGPDPLHEEKFLKGVIAAAPLYAAAQAREKEGDLTGAAEAGNAAYWALQHSQIVAFQYRVLSTAGRFKDCERMLDLMYREQVSSQDRRLIPLYLEQERYNLAHKLLEDVYLKLPDGQERNSLYETDQQCMASRKAAIEAAKRSIEHPAVDVPNLSKAALFFYFAKEYELSCEALQKAIAVEPNVGQHHGDLADALYALKRREEAETHYRKALSLDSDSLQRLIWSVRTGVDPTTAEYFTHILKWDPHAENFAWIGSTFVYGRTFQGTTKAWDAIKAYEIALGLQPDHPQASQWRERLRYIEGLVERVKAEREMERLHGDPTKIRLLGLQNYQRFGYGNPGSWNQFNTAYWQAQVPS